MKGAFLIVIDFSEGQGANPKDCRFVETARDSLSLAIRTDAFVTTIHPILELSSTELDT